MPQHLSSFLRRWSSDQSRIQWGYQSNLSICLCVMILKLVCQQNVTISWFWCQNVTFSIYFYFGKITWSTANWREMEMQDKNVYCYILDTINCNVGMYSREIGSVIYQKEYFTRTMFFVDSQLPNWRNVKSTFVNLFESMTLWFLSASLFPEFYTLQSY